jgi:hypothetical protein
MKGFALLFFMVSGCAMHTEKETSFLSLQAQAKSICEIMENPPLYAGRRLVIKGIYFVEPHQRMLYDEDCPDVGLRVSHSSKLRGDAKARAIIEKFRKKHPTVRVPVIYSGILSGRQVVQGCSQTSCYSYWVQDAELLAASPR